MKALDHYSKGERLERLRTRAVYESGINGAASADARAHLATIKGWAQGLRP